MWSKGRQEGGSVQTIKNEEQLWAVPDENQARRERETLSRWDWVERTVWNARMLNALETGVKGAKWYSLMDKVYRPANLEAACNQVISNRGAAGADQVKDQKLWPNAYFTEIGLYSWNKARMDAVQSYKGTR